MKRFFHVFFMVFVASVCVGAEESWEILAVFRALGSGSTDVVLELADGRLIQVPLASLASDARQKALSLAAMSSDDSNSATSESKATASAPSSDLLADAAALVQKCRSAREAANFYRLLSAVPGLTTGQTAECAKSLRHWDSPEIRDRVRHDRTWVTKDEAVRAENEADAVVDHACELIRLGNPQLAVDSLDKASRLGQGSVRTEFMAGLLAMQQRQANLTKAMEKFSAVIDKQGGNAAALNNLAVCEVMARRPDLAVKHFRQAIESTRNGQVIADNVGGMVAASNGLAAKGPRISERVLTEFNDLYRSISQASGLKARSDVGGLALLGLNGHTCAVQALTLDETMRLSEACPKDAGHDGVWLGVVIGPGVVLTSADVAKAGPRLTVAAASPKTDPLPAKLVSSLGDTDYAVIACDGLQAPPLPVATNFPAAGADVLAVGARRDIVLQVFPSFEAGRILPLRGDVDSSAEFFVHDAGVPAEISGGAVCDSEGRLIGVSPGSRLVSEYKKLRLAVKLTALRPAVDPYIPANESIPGMAAASSDSVESRVRASIVIVSAFQQRADTESEEVVGSTAQ